MAQGCCTAWNIHDMERAIKSVLKNKRTLRGASLHYNVPKSTLHDKVNGNHALDSRRGPKTRLPPDLERELYNIAIEKDKIGMTKTDFLSVAGQFAADNGKAFSRGTPSMAWYRKFVVRMRKTIELEMTRGIPKKKKKHIKWSPSKRKSRMPRKVRRAHASESDSESSSSSDEEVSSNQHSSSESEPQIASPKKKRGRKKTSSKAKRPSSSVHVPKSGHRGKKSIVKKPYQPSESESESEPAPSPPPRKKHKKTSTRKSLPPPPASDSEQEVSSPSSGRRKGRSATKAFPPPTDSDEEYDLSEKSITKSGKQISGKSQRKRRIYIQRPPRKRSTYHSDVEYENSGDEKMAKAIDAIKNKQMTYKRAADVYHVPRSTLHDHVKKGYEPGAKRGKKPVLNMYLERELFDLARKREHLGLTRPDFLEMAGELAREHNCPFKNGRPSQSWYMKMMKRSKEKRCRGSVPHCRSPNVPKVKLKLTTVESQLKKAEQSDHPYSVPFYTTEVEVTPYRHVIKNQINERVKSALEEHLTREDTVPCRIEQLADLAESMSQELAAHQAQVKRERAERSATSAELESQSANTDETAYSSGDTDSVPTNDPVDMIVASVVETVHESCQGPNVVVEETEVVEIQHDDQSGEVGHVELARATAKADVRIDIDMGNVKRSIEGVPRSPSEMVKVMTASANARSVTTVSETKMIGSKELIPPQQPNDFYIVCDSEPTGMQKIHIEEVLSQLAQNSGQNIRISGMITQSQEPQPEQVQYMEFKDIAHNMQEEGVQYIQVLADGGIVQETETMQEGVPEEYLLKAEHSEQDVQHLLVDSSMIVRDEDNVEYVLAEEIPGNMVGEDNVEYVLAEEIPGDMVGEDNVTYVIADDRNVVVVPQYVAP